MSGAKRDTAAQRSQAYAVLAGSFSYADASSGPLRIAGADYNQAFDPAVNPQACSLRERAHIDSDQSALFEELARFYEFFGLARSENAELPDHLAVELEFMHYLTYLESRAEPGSESAAGLRRAQRDFLDRHLVRLVRSVDAQLHSAPAACVKLVQVSRAFIEDEQLALTASADAADADSGLDLPLPKIAGRDAPQAEDHSRRYT